MKGNAELRPNYFSANVSIVVVVFRQQSNVFCYIYNFEPFWGP